MWALLHICLLLLIAVPAHARAPAAATGDDHVHLAWPWNTDPIVLVPVLALDLPYVVAIVRLWSRAGAGRGVPVWRALAYAVGLAALFAALVSPLDAAADASFALHMTQHMLLMVVAAPLMVLGNFGMVALMALPSRLRVPLGRGRDAGGRAPCRRLAQMMSGVFVPQEAPVPLLHSMSRLAPNRPWPAQPAATLPDPIRRGQSASAHFGPKQVTREIRGSERMTIASARSTERQRHP